MIAPFWVHDLAENFWTQAGIPEPFPRDLRRPIALALPLSVVSLPSLRVSGIDAWLRRQGVTFCAGVLDRPLRACLVAHHGHGIIFVDGTDPADEQRFSLAHELAHYLKDYRRPRLLVQERLGDTALEVLDGERPPVQSERIHSLLANVPIGAYFHLMDRHRGRVSDPAIARSEADADRLAWELLAPEDDVRRSLAGLPACDLPGLLRHRYGLPDDIAARYAAALRPQPPEPRSLLRYLRTAVEADRPAAGIPGDPT